MEKTVMKSKNNRTPSMNAVNSWSNCQPQRNPKEEQPVVNSLRSHRKSVASSVSNQEEDSALCHQRTKDSVIRTHSTKDSDVAPVLRPRTHSMKDNDAAPAPRFRAHSMKDGDAAPAPRFRAHSMKDGDAAPVLRPRTHSMKDNDAAPVLRPRTHSMKDNDAAPVARPRTHSMKDNDAAPVARPHAHSMKDGNAAPVWRSRRHSMKDNDAVPAPLSRAHSMKDNDAVPVVRPYGKIAPVSVRVKTPARTVSPKNVSDEPLSHRVRWGAFPWLSKKVVVTFFVTLLALVGGILYLNNTVSVVAIVVNEKHFGYTSSMNESQEVIYNAMHTLGEEKIEDINTQTDDKIFYVPQRVDKKTFDANQASADDIAQYVKAYIPGFAISVNDQEVMVLNSQEEAEALLDEIKAYYADASETNAVSSVVFEENISVVESKAQPLDIKTKKQAFQALIDGKTQNIDYTVMEGETIWEIAQKNNVTIESIAAENKGLNVESDPEAGTLIKVVTVQPYLNVVVEGIRVVSETIEFNTDTKKDATLALGKTNVKQEGELGSKDVTFTYVSRNGVVSDQDKIIIDEIITKEPVTKIVLEGTAKTRLASSGGSSVVARGSGSVPSMIRPCSGSVTSRFRTASRPNHTGVDIANPVGTSIYAAASGTVVLRSWSGGYGNCVLVDHGNGVATRYAHLSSYNVQLGDVVSQGDKIGGMGNTGNSSGSHLHFEVIINGTCYNPENYI